jgi:hypothetical protein
MKTIIITLSILILASPIYSQVQSDCEKSWGLDHYYKYDVAYLSFKRLYDIASSDTNKIFIPQIHQDSIWKGLAAIYNAFSIPQRDSIFDMYCVHNTIQYGSPLYPAIQVELDTTYEWTHNWLNDEIITGYAELDSFISEYNYTIQQVYSSTNEVVINSDLPVNPNPIIESLLLFDGIIDAYPSLVTSNGNKINYKKVGNDQFFDFTVAWGDCLSGCIYKHKWKFKVDYSNCIVEYIGLESNADEDFPIPINCNITSIENLDQNNNESIVVYPNPSSDLITIKSNNIIHVEVWSNFRLIKSCEYNKQNLINLDIRDLSSGLLIIKVKTETESLIRKFIKK